MRVNLLIVVAIAAVALGPSPRSITAQDDFRAPTIQERLRDPVYMSWVTQKKVSACIECHTEGPNIGSIAGGQSVRMTAFSRRVEMERWVALDKHTIARRRVEPYRADQEEAELTAMIDRLIEQQATALDDLKNKGIEFDTSVIMPRSIPEDWMGDSNILSRRICDKLGYEVSQASGYEKFRDNCLTCHGGYQAGDSGFTFAAKGQEQIGIDCLYCHQQGDNDAWVLSHIDANRWRLQPPDAKSAAGMRNLPNTSVQSSLCLDCHVGNRDKQMFVTHQMYAAGHPPLPSIELQTFCAEMPQHWQTPSQLYRSLDGDPGRETYFQVNYPGVAGPVDSDSSAGQTYWKTRKLVIGALAARKQTLDLVIQSADSHRWADYSLYDCASCHHELQSDSRRQYRGFPAAPGRPRQHEWPSALLTVASHWLADSNAEGPSMDQSIRKLDADLTARFAERPFGNAEQVVPAAQALRDEIVKAMETIESMPLTESTATTVIRHLAQTPSENLLTYDSARQVVWAIQVVAEELSEQGQPLADKAAEVVRSLGDADLTGIQSKLPSGRGRFIFPAGLQDDLKRRANFDPDSLKTQLDRLRDLLAENAPSHEVGADLVSKPLRTRLQR